MMIESALTLHSIVSTYRSHRGCSDDTFEMMLEDWAENVFAEECRPIDYGLVSCVSRTDVDAPEEVEEEALTLMPRTPLMAASTDPDAPAGHSSEALCPVCNGSGSRVGILPILRSTCPACNGSGRAQ